MGKLTHCCFHMMARVSTLSASSTLKILPSIQRWGDIGITDCCCSDGHLTWFCHFAACQVQGHNTLNKALSGAIEVGNHWSLPLRNALIINEWIGEKMQGRTPEECLAWVEGMLETLDQHVYLTTTLTTDRDMALRLFVNFNSASNKVALEDIDVIKVALVHQVDRREREAQVGGQKRTNRLPAGYCLHSKVSNIGEANAVRTEHSTHVCRTPSGQYLSCGTKPWAPAALFLKSAPSCSAPRVSDQLWISFPQLSAED